MNHRRWPEGTNRSSNITCVLKSEHRVGGRGGACQLSRLVLPFLFTREPKGAFFRFREGGQPLFYSQFKMGFPLAQEETCFPAVGDWCNPGCAPPILPQIFTVHPRDSRLLQRHEHWKRKGGCLCSFIPLKNIYLTLTVLLGTFHCWLDFGGYSDEQGRSGPSPQLDSSVTGRQIPSKRDSKYDGCCKKGCAEGRGIAWSIDAAASAWVWGPRGRTLPSQRGCEWHWVWSKPRKSGQDKESRQEETGTSSHFSLNLQELIWDPSLNHREPGAVFF